MDATLGFTRLEIINNVLDSVGRTGDATLQARLANDINTAQLSFWKMFDWDFGRVNGLFNGNSIEILNRVTDYELTGTDFFSKTWRMRATDLESVYISYSNVDKARKLTRVEKPALVAYDPATQIAGPQSVPEVYAITNNTSIQISPNISDLSLAQGNPTGVFLYVDGKRQPNFMSNDSAYPDVPIEYQETFTQYLLYRTLSRERDPRQTEELAIFEKMLRADKEANLALVENSLRLKFGDEDARIATNRPGNSNIYQNFWDEF